jgi:carbamoyl-phosphate synthase large subunit
MSEEPNAMSLIDDGRIDLVVNIPREYDRLGRPDGYLIRRRAVEAAVPLITDFQSARAMVAALRAYKKSPPKILAWQDYVTRDARPLQR